MGKTRFLGVALGFLLVACQLTGVALAGIVPTSPQGVLPGGEIGWYQQTGGNQLSNTGDYSWWYGCSPTSAGMIMGFYDRNGYDGLSYSNLVPGGVAEATTYGGLPSYLASAAIASAGNIADFYSGGYLASGDDKPVSALIRLPGGLHGNKPGLGRQCQRFDDLLLLD